MIDPHTLLLLSSFFLAAQSSPSAPEITPPPVLRRTLDNDPAFRGYTSTLGSWSPLYCNGDYTYSDFGNIADCCSVVGICHPATDCGTDYEGSTRAIKYQGGDTLTCFDTTCGTQTIFRTQGDPKPLSIFGCFAGGELYLTTPGSPAKGSAGKTTTNQGAAQTSSTTDSSDPSSISNPTSTSSTKPQGHLIAIGSAIGLVLLLAIAGLIAWIVILKKRNSKAKSNTELQKIQGHGTNPGGGSDNDLKAELPTNEGWAYEMSPESAPASRQEHKPWTNLSPLPNSPAPSYSPATQYQGTVSPLGPAGTPGGDPYSTGQGRPHAGMPGPQGARPYYQELPASARPQYAELG